MNVSYLPAYLISPTDTFVQFDKMDRQNESYICFQCREIKAVHKTHALQVTSSDKLLCLQSELLSSLDLAKNVLNREALKRDVAYQSQNVWEKRLKLATFRPCSHTQKGNAFLRKHPLV